MSELDAHGAAELGELLDSHVQAGQWPDVVAILDEHWGAVLSSDPAAIQRAVNALPETVLEANPRWALAADYVNRYVTNGSTPTTIFRGTAPTPEPTNLLDVLAQLTSKIAARRAGGRYADAVDTAREARSLLDDADDATRASLKQALPEIVFQWAMAWEYYGDTDRATREYTESFDAAAAIGHRIAEASAAGALAWMHGLAGRNIQARMWLNWLPYTGGEWWGNRASVAARFAQAQLFIDDLDIENARDELARVNLAGVPERWPAQKYLLALTETDPAQCIDLLTQIDSSAASLPANALQGGAWAPFVAIARSILLSRLENWPGARASLDDVATTTRDVDFGILQMRLRKAAAQLLAGDVTRARRKATVLVGASTASPRILVGALAVAGAAAARLGETDAAAKQVSMALRLADEHRLYVPLTIVPAEDSASLFELLPDPLPTDIRNALLSDSLSTRRRPVPAIEPRRTCGRTKRRVPPQHGRSRRPAVRIPEHCQDAAAEHLPQARCSIAGSP